jgi:hypothetical protein
LQIYGATQGIHDTGKFDQNAVAGGVGDTAPEFGDSGIDEFGTMGAERGDRRLLVGRDQPAVTGHVDGDNGR